MPAARHASCRKDRTESRRNDGSSRCRDEVTGLKIFRDLGNDHSLYWVKPTLHLIDEFSKSTYRGKGSTHARRSSPDSKSPVHQTSANIQTLLLRCRLGFRMFNGSRHWRSILPPGGKSRAGHRCASPHPYA